MNIFLWVLQALLALGFAGAGVAKTTQPKDKLAKNMHWVEDFSPATVRFIGTMELLGAVGLILPAATGILTWFTPLAATGLAVVMALAAATHIRRTEPREVVFTVILFVLAAVVAWGRFGPYAF